MNSLARLILITIALVLLVAGCASPLPTPITPTANPQTAAAWPQPASTSASEASTLTPIEELGKTGTPIKVDIATYRLTVDGLVEHPLSLSYDEILALPSVSQIPRLECPGFFVNYAEWTGPLVRTLLEKAVVKPSASEVEFYDGSKPPYHKPLTLEEALREDTFLAYKVNGQTLPVEHGYPLRLVAGSKLGSYWVKWLFRIEVK